MANIAAMIDLDEFPKSGVRLPRKIRNWVKSQCMDLEGKVEYLDGKVTQEGLMAIATLHLMEMDGGELLALVRGLAPRLESLFEAEMPASGGAGGESLPREVAPGEGRGHEGGAWEDVPLEGTLLPKKKARPKRSGNGGKGA